MKTITLRLNDLALECLSELKQLSLHKTGTKAILWAMQTCAAQAATIAYKENKISALISEVDELKSIINYLENKKD